MKRIEPYGMPLGRRRLAAAEALAENERRRRAANAIWNGRIDAELFRLYQKVWDLGAQ